MKGFIVMEHAEDFEQGLALRCGGKYPAAGVLDWGEPVAIFHSAKDARAAITRTEHYRQAFGDFTMPAAKFCKVKKAQTVEVRGVFCGG